MMQTSGVSVPKVYIDGIAILYNEFGFTIVLGNLSTIGNQEGHIDVGVMIGISPQTAKTLKILIGKMVKEYEEKLGNITLSNKLLHDMGLEEDMR